MTYATLPADLTIFTALQLWLMDVLALPAEQVAHEMDNQVPMPEGGFVLMNHVSKHELNTTTQQFNDALQMNTYEKSIEYILQTDCYGESASDWINTIQTLWKSDNACTFLEPYGFDPLYSEDSQHIQFANGEAQYEERWTCRLHLQFNATVTTALTSATEITVSKINVNATYH